MAVHNDISQNDNTDSVLLAGVKELVETAFPKQEDTTNKRFVNSKQKRKAFLSLIILCFLVVLTDLIISILNGNNIFLMISCKQTLLYKLSENE